MSRSKGALCNQSRSHPTADSATQHSAMDPYLVLGMSRECSLKEAKKARGKLQRPESKEKCQQFNNAYKQISNPLAEISYGFPTSQQSSFGYADEVKDRIRKKFDRMYERFDRMDRRLAEVTEKLKTWRRRSISSGAVDAGRRTISDGRQLCHNDYANIKWKQ